MKKLKMMKKMRIKLRDHKIIKFKMNKMIILLILISTKFRIIRFIINNLIRKM